MYLLVYMRKFKKMTGWAGTVFGILGAVLVAANTGLNDIGYIFFFVGSTFSLHNAITKKDNANSILWGVFLLINLFGLFSYAN